MSAPVINEPLLPQKSRAAALQSVLSRGSAPDVALPPDVRRGSASPLRLSKQGASPLVRARPNVF